MNDTIIYEQPLNERIRIFLRLEFLFAQAAHHMHGGNLWDSRSTLTGLLDILSIFGRTDLKTEVLKELERHASTLTRLQQNPEIDNARLKHILAELEKLSRLLHQSGGPIAAELKAHEFLSSIQQRAAIPGGTCDFDVPSYHFWLQQSAEQRTKDLASWLRHFEVVAQAIQLIVRLVRDSTELQPVTANAGFFQKTLNTQHPCQLVRVAVPKNLPYYAEISGGRHRFTVRFLEFSRKDGHVKQTTQDIDLRLACCTI